MFRFTKLSAPILFAFYILAVSTVPSTASKIVQSQFLNKTINVNISFSTQTPIIDFDEQTVSTLRNAARSMFYQMTLKECAALKEIIANTCKLRSLNVSSRINQQRNQSTSLYITGSAQFAITLKK